MMARYTNEKNILMLVALLKQHNISNVIASPGATNVSFVASVQSDPFFNVISCVDERSAAYMACGIAAETNKPVVLSCTGATASRNYAPGLTEAFYRHLPVIAVTASQHLGRIGQNVAQVLDRSQQFADMVKKSIQLYEIHTSEDEWACNLALNNVILESQRNGGGPVHINMITTYDNGFDVTELKPVRKIERIENLENAPEIKHSEVAIFIGEHAKFSAELTAAIDEFCEKYNAVVICDHPSKYHGKYRIIPNLITLQDSTEKFKKIPFLIDLGNVSGIYSNIQPAEVWRVSPDGEIRDTFKKMTHVFESDELNFFKHYNSLRTIKKNTEYYTTWKNKYDNFAQKLNNLDLPFSNLWIAKEISRAIGSNDVVHLGILNTLRSWDLTAADNEAEFYCNTGGFGIDGVLSSALGNSLVTDKKVYCIIGDLAFFYDMNAIGNRHLKNNLRVLLVNNGCGTEFHNFNHRASKVSKQNGLSTEFFAADGHFGNKSKDLVKHYAEDLGFQYLSASNKEELLEAMKTFTAEKSPKPILLEAFTDEKDESNALKMVYGLNFSSKTVAKKILGEKGKRIVKKMLGK